MENISWETIPIILFIVVVSICVGIGYFIGKRKK